MSWTRLTNDPCAYQKELRQSTSSLDYVFDRNRYVSCQPCRVELGTFGGKNTGGSLSTLVDVESDLLNINRKLSNCPERHYLPDCVGCNANNGNPCGNCQAHIQINHLPTCNLYEHSPRVTTPGYNMTYSGCAFEEGATNGNGSVNQPYFNPINASNVPVTVMQNKANVPSRGSNRGWW